MRENMVNKQFAERLNQELDTMGVPKPMEERYEAFAKIINVSAFKASLILDGNVPTDKEILNKIAQELEINVADWLQGKTNPQI